MAQNRVDWQYSSAFIDERLKLWDELKTISDGKKRECHPISVTLPDGTVKKCMSNDTTPYQIALGISGSLAREAIVAKDMNKTRSLYGLCHCERSIVGFESPI
ncbi:threonine--tRNA ligase, cytoplasmic-like isoform X3 [Schistocerca gregaria]|uniref:threonine--tRNA ligase, cytoplasmic-like isoform X3 n=1 Tax=Schistocerca gregaria TaxID=7010 RepID=UPI00211DF9DA|nr:threonine--tRNA ligase, cytoplasmic-like isoform X3 [Schistocerca gregaria]